MVKITYGAVTVECSEDQAPRVIKNLQKKGMLPADFEKQETDAPGGAIANAKRSLGAQKTWAEAYDLAEKKGIPLQQARTEIALARKAEKESRRGKILAKANARAKK